MFAKAPRWLGHSALLGFLAVLSMISPPSAAPAPPGGSDSGTLVVSPPPGPIWTVAEAPATPLAGVERSVPVTRTPAPTTLSDWVQSARSTPLQAGPATDAPRFNLLPPERYLKILESRGAWLLVAYGGDDEGRSAGTAWVQAADVVPLKARPAWVRNVRPASLWSGAEAGAERSASLPTWSSLELLGEDRAGRLPVRDPGDGRFRPPRQAWISRDDVVPTQPPSKAELPWAYPATTRPDLVRLLVPYRSQLDGTPWAAANCGPTTLGMALDAFGISVSSTQLRRDVLNAQQIWGDDVGSLMEALVAVAERRGLRVLNFWEGSSLKRWSVEEIRRHVRAGQPVIAQVSFRALPGRSDSPYDGDHFIIVTGLVGDDLLYNDSIDSDGLGFDRIIGPEQFRQAMNASDQRYAYAAFAVARP